ncbi:dTDP-glucose 4,6-dehydratase [Campylobacter coli]|uniref:dTDP-glucose 4,6-dehydratase n=4 Tax=Pseudomonadati TaxID=3379134 RepID=UPI00128906FF|nr:dTDP-glucose 4,6-dehydratase [Campylobacter coli]EAI7058899.1 dTDP-glucose 4,6-dehydratase [Campylobacter coli]EDO7861399.1 dTDP-glucose 4,6-dehydratase [Campylobacter coli]EGP2593850.1 dTDP-glucose 4,6-dehydratase [Campylobacter coli]EIA3699207.1 dTDP-glucose 4,6-dehydratase [Campylobacter coli]EIJ3167154.1 dTDP-glucose 4,6-dehydratase [Campylobacter coli]
MNNVLITGGAGFIGSNFIEFYCNKYPNDKVVNLDLLTYAGNLENLKDISSNKNYIFYQGNICDIKLVEKVINTHKINIIIHFAAESHVDNSISSPDVFIKTNVDGTFNLLYSAYKTWFEEPFKAKVGFENALFYHISTDEVFGSLGEEGYFSESTPYAPNSPYSASKASSDMLVRSFHYTYGLNAVISNCSNNYGAKQHDEKLIPTIIRKALNGENIPIYGDGKNVRDWLYVNDHCEAIDKILHFALQSKGNFFDTFNIGGNEEWKNIDIATLICEILDKKFPKARSHKEQITFVKDRAGHDKRYAIDSSKLQKELRWKPKESFESGILKTIEWYVEKYKDNF